MPPVPETGWRPPTDFPNLSAAKVIGLDTETWDPELTEAGPGWGRGKGHIIGVSLAVQDGTKWYFPIRHGIDERGQQILPPHEAALNMDPEKVLKWLNFVLNTPVPKVGANLIYDVGWLAQEKVNVTGPLFDIQFAEALLDSETPNVALEILAKTHLGLGKTTDELYHWLSSWNGTAPTDKQRKWLYVTPPSLAGPYAEDDAALPIRIMEKQWKALHERGVLDLFLLECRLTPLLVKMRMKGAPVDLEVAERVYDDLGGRTDKLSHRMRDMVGFEVNPNAQDSMIRSFEQLGLPIPKKLDKKTQETKTSFDKSVLGAIDHPFVGLVTEHRMLSKVRNTFMKSYIMEKHVKSRIHCSFHPLKGDTNGTRSGRLASSDPNLQNIPIQTEEGKLVREAFTGTLFGNRWRSYDYSSIEYRILAHFATGMGSDEVRAIYASNPKADYHKIVGDLIKNMTGIDLERLAVKRINFGIIYGMALPALATALKLSRDEAKDLLDKYHAAAPYARATMDACANEVHETGIVRTILNRASDFNAWGPIKYDGERHAVSYGEACRTWGAHNVKRQMTHKALNRKLQGSAADIMKKAMVDAYEAGLFEEWACGIPVLTVHDELDFEDKGDLDNPAWVELRHMMEHCADHLLRVPLLVEGDVGNNWAEAH